MTATCLFLPGGGIPAGADAASMVVLVADVGVCAAWCVGLVDAPSLRDKRVFALVHCWVSGAALVVPVGPLSHG